MDLSTRYVVKGLGKEQKINSLIEIHMDGDKISKVADKWDGSLPEGSIAQVGLSSFSWYRYAEAWGFYTWSFVWETRVWRVREMAFPPRASPKNFHHCLVLSVCLKEKTNLTFLVGFPQTQRYDRADYGWCAQER